MSRAPVLAAATFACFVFFPVAAHSAEECSVVLTATGRNLLTSLDRDDLEAYYYKKVCESGETTASLDAFEQAQKLLGVTYANKTAYCSSEASKFKNYKYRRLETSTVMESSTAAWLKCIELNRKGILVTPTIAPRLVTFAFSRGGKTNGRVKGVNASNGISCKVSNAAGTEVALTNGSLTYDLRLDDVDTLTVMCERTAVEDSTQRYYPAGDVTIVTSEGPLSLQLDVSILGKETWSREVQARFATQELAIAGLAKDLKDVYTYIPDSIDFSVTKHRFAGVSNTYNTESPYCDNGWLAVAAVQGNKGGEVGVVCHQIRLVRRDRPEWWEKP